MSFDQPTATLLAASIAACVAFVGLLINLRIFCITRQEVSRAEKERARIQTTLNIFERVQLERRQHLYLQLSDFYDPIYALLTVNGMVFDRVGPASASRLDFQYPTEENARVWGELVESVILPNNRRICEIISTKLHLLHPDDSVESYMQFILHAQAYDVFRKAAYEAYREFRFPLGFQKHVEIHRAKVKNDLAELLRDKE